MLEIGGKTILTRLIETLRPLVPFIHVVVGYREELVIELCASKHRDVILVRNPKYRDTNTGESMAIGAKGCDGRVIFLDGDLLISPYSIRQFLYEAQSRDLLIGITPTQSENAVCVELIGDGKEHPQSVKSFRPSSVYPFEWANVVAGPSDLMNDVKGYVYERLKEYLPAPGFSLDLCEVDTEEDLERAKFFARSLSNEGGGRRSSISQT